ncbi:MAG: tetratricopeptide repeat protein [Euryarchaeota archaeon]|nr:tetratricopeptide repeat protein [Euryarchaeota archaeon]
MADSLKCAVCGAINAAGVRFCESCGVELTPSASQEPEIDKLLQELADRRPAKAGEGKEGLDLEKEIVDELLDSLLVEEAADHFDCPLCGTQLPLEAKKCPKCGAVFAEVGKPAVKLPPPPPAEEAAPGPVKRAPKPAPVTPPKPAAVSKPEVKPEPRPAPKPEPVAEVVAAHEETPVPVAVTEQAPTLRIWSGKLIDFVVLGTAAGLVAVFVGFQMYSWTSLGQNPTSLAVFLGVAIAGMASGFVLFRLSTSAIAQGDKLVKEGRHEEALYYYDRAIRMGSKPASAWTSKGVAFKRLGRFDEAMRCHNTALKLDPGNEIAWCNKGDLYFRAGQMGNAIECYDKAIRKRPRYAIAWNNKGAALARLNRLEEARRCHDEAVKLSPRYVAAWLNRGEVLARLGLREEAQRSLEKARALGS